jgi:Fur family ferric uptake transcriptional regulator
MQVMKRVEKQPPTVRNTSHRNDIIALLEKTEAFLSSQEIHQLLKSSGSAIGLATVYRQLEKLLSQKKIDEIVSPSGERMYRYCGQIDHHHHHLVCRLCGATKEILLPEIETIAETVMTKYGYSDVTHSVEVFGICSDCARIQSVEIKSRAKPRSS